MNTALIKVIFRYASSLIVYTQTVEMNEQTKNCWQENKFYHIVRLTRNKVCHFESFGRPRYEKLLINIVLLYRIFGFNVLLDKKVNKEWEIIMKNNDNDTESLYTFNGDNYENYDTLFSYVSDSINHSEFHRIYQYFYDFIWISVEVESKCKLPFGPQLTDPFVEELDVAKVIMNYISPIIIWTADITNDKQAKVREIKNTNFFQIANESRNLICHFFNDSNKQKMTESLEIILSNMVQLYEMFGVDLSQCRERIKNISREKFQDFILRKRNKKTISKDDIFNDVKKVLNSAHSNKSFYMKFGRILHYQVATMISKGDMITQVFINPDQDIFVEWCDWERRFLYTEVERNFNRKIIYKFSSPIFIWLQLVEIWTNETERNTVKRGIFYRIVKTTCDGICRYMTEKCVNRELENVILTNMVNLYKYFKAMVPNCSTNEYMCVDVYGCQKYVTGFEFIEQPFYYLFKQLVYYNVQARIDGSCSFSSLFQYYFYRRRVRNDFVNMGREYDIYNFSGVFFIFMELVSRDLGQGIENDPFVIRVREARDSIAKYMTDFISNDKENLKIDNSDRNEVYQKMWDIFSRFGFIPGSLVDGEMKYFINNSQLNGWKMEIINCFVKLVHYIVATRRNVEIIGRQKFYSLDKPYYQNGTV